MGRIAAVGVFDGVHRGHRYLIDQLRADAGQCGLEPVAVTFRNHPLAVVCPGREPLRLTDADTRRRMLMEAGVTAVIELDFDHRLMNMSASEFMQILHRDHGVERLLLGFNNRIGHDRVGSAADYAAIGRSVGVTVDIAREYTGAGAPVSSSIIRNYLANGDIEAAVSALGYPYSFNGKVVTGKQLGRTIGFPTANVAPVSGIQLPGAGVYAAQVTTADGTSYPSMLNIGHRPTVDSVGAPISIEAHLIDFQGNLYGQDVTVTPVTRLRDEQRFPTLEALQAQLGADREACLRYFVYNH